MLSQRKLGLFCALNPTVLLPLPWWHFERVKSAIERADRSQVWVFMALFSMKRNTVAGPLAPNDSLQLVLLVCFHVGLDRIVFDGGVEVQVRDGITDLVTDPPMQRAT
uniref:Uncharacterized protein n=1 Tax=Romanomermis culicivorax TaxID=13658 RepID=A0A915IFB6_ROMCU